MINSLLGYKFYLSFVTFFERDGLKAQKISGKFLVIKQEAEHTGDQVHVCLL